MAAKAHLTVLGIALVAIGAGGAGWKLSHIPIRLPPPKMDRIERYGESLYASACERCHGHPAAGKGLQGPALLTGLYGPGTPDFGRLSRAVLTGSGAMPPIKHLNREDVRALSRYLSYKASQRDGSSS